MVTETVTVLALKEIVWFAVSIHQQGSANLLHNLGSLVSKCRSIRRLYSLRHLAILFTEVFDG